MARTKHKARDNEVTDREQYATLVQSRLWRGRNLHILLNQRKGRKKNASKYKVLLANALLVQRVQSVSREGGWGGAKLILIKCMSNFGQRAGCRLQMTAINCSSTHSRKVGGGGAAQDVPCQKSALLQHEESLQNILGNVQ